MRPLIIMMMLSVILLKTLWVMLLIGICAMLAKFLWGMI